MIPDQREKYSNYSDKREIIHEDVFYCKSFLIYY